MLLNTIVGAALLVIAIALIVMNVRHYRKRKKNIAWFPELIGTPVKSKAADAVHSQAVVQPLSPHIASLPILSPIKRTDGKYRLIRLGATDKVTFDEFAPEELTLVIGEDISYLTLDQAVVLENARRDMQNRANGLPNIQDQPKMDRSSAWMDVGMVSIRAADGSLIGSSADVIEELDKARFHGEEIDVEEATKRAAERLQGQD